LKDLNDIIFVLNDMVRHGVSLEPMNYLAYMFGPYDQWPDNREGVLPGVFKIVDHEDRIGPVLGSS